MLVPIIKVVFFVLDIIKDVALLRFLFSLLIAEFSEDKRTSFDFFLVVLGIFAISIGQLTILAYALKNRNEALSICPHNTPTLTKAVISICMTIMFPFVGIWMSWEKYFDSQILDDLFEEIANKGDWVEKGKGLEKENFEKIICHGGFLEDSKMYGFSSIKMLESLLESFWQVLVMALIYQREPYGGV